MTTIEEKILSYPHLSRDEQREVEAYVEDHPEWAPLLRDVQALEEMTQAYASDLPDWGTLDDTSSALDVLASYVVAKHLHPNVIPPALQEPFERLEARMEDDPDLRARAETMQQRVDEAEAAVDPVAHFEALSGHRLTETTDASPAAPTDDAPADPTDANGVPTPDRAADRAARTSSSRDSIGSRLVGTPARMAVAALALIAVVYGGLYGVSYSSQSTLDRLATVNVDQSVIDNYRARVRSPIPEAEEDTTADDLYLQALPLLRNARTSTLGLFPHFDYKKLGEAEELLQRVVERTDPGSFLRLEAYFYLGKVNLAQGDVEQARTHFKRVVDQEGRRVSEAYRILRQIQQEYPAARSQGG